MNTRVSRCALIALLLLAAPALAQQGTTEVRGRVIDSQGAILPGVNVTVRNQDTGMFRETVSNADGTYFVSGIVPGRYEISAELQGFKKYTPARRPARDRQDRDARRRHGGRRPRGDRHRLGRIADRRRHIEGSWRQRHRARARRAAVGQPQLRRVRRPAARRRSRCISTESFGSDSVTVNGQDARNNNYMLDGANNNDDVIGQRAGHAGAHADRSGAGVPGADQPVRRRVRPHHRRDHQRRDQAGNQRAAAGTRVRVLPGRRHDGGDVLREEERHRQPDEAGHVAAAVGRHDRRSDRARTRRTSSAASSA